MVIYGEDLFIENFIAGIIIIHITSKICGIESGKIRITSGGIMCGIFSFVIFLDMEALASALIKASFSVFISFVVFYGNADKVRIIRAAIVFFAVTVFMGGCAVSIMYLSGLKGISANGYAYAETPTYIRLALGISVSYMMISSIADFIKEKYDRRDFSRKVILRACGMEFTLKGYTDTANCLKEPISGSPVFLITSEAAERTIYSVPEEEQMNRYCAIPFKAAGTENGILDGFRADDIRLIRGTDENGSSYFRPAYIAVYNGAFEIYGKNGSYDILLNREILEGGII